MYSANSILIAELITSISLRIMTHEASLYYQIIGNRFDIFTGLRQDM